MDECTRNNFPEGYSWGTCYDINWGFILPCHSKVIFEQQTDGCCCHHVFTEGILIPLNEPKIIGSKLGKNGKIKVRYLLSELADLNGNPGKNYKKWKKSVSEKWEEILKKAHIDLEFTTPPEGMPGDQEGFRWVIYKGHQEGWGNAFNIDAWKNKPIVLVYPNSD
jgi:hypothetical protein